MNLKITERPHYRKIVITKPKQTITQYYGEKEMMQVTETELEDGHKEYTNIRVDLATNDVLEILKKKV